MEIHKYINKIQNKLRQYVSSLYREKIGGYARKNSYRTITLRKDMKKKKALLIKKNEINARAGTKSMKQMKTWITGGIEMKSVWLEWIEQGEKY